MSTTTDALAAGTLPTGYYPASSVFPSASTNSTSTSSTSTTTGGTAAAAPSSNQQLSQSDFLNLLVTQMKNQDPLSPQSDTDMAAQMAQFTSLSTAQTTEGDIKTMSGNQQIQEAISMIGHQVAITVGTGVTAQTITGPVTGIAMNGTAAQLTVNGFNYDLSSVVSVDPNGANSGTPSTSSSNTTTNPQP